MLTKSLHAWASALLLLAGQGAVSARGFSDGNYAGSGALLARDLDRAWGPTDGAALEHLLRRSVAAVLDRRALKGGSGGSRSPSPAPAAPAPRPASPAPATAPAPASQAPKRPLSPESSDPSKRPRVESPAAPAPGSSQPSSPGGGNRQSTPQSPSGAPGGHAPAAGANPLAGQSGNPQQGAGDHNWKPGAHNWASGSDQRTGQNSVGDAERISREATNHQGNRDNGFDRDTTNSVLRKPPHQTTSAPGQHTNDGTALAQQDAHPRGESPTPRQPGAPPPRVVTQDFHRPGSPNIYTQHWPTTTSPGGTERYDPKGPHHAYFRADNGEIPAGNPGPAFRKRSLVAGRAGTAGELRAALLRRALDRAVEAA